MTISADRLHVIRCYDRLPPLEGGMECHIAQLTAAQRRQGVRVTEVYNDGIPAGEAVQLWRGRSTHLVRPNALRWSLFYGAMVFRQLDLSDGRTPILHIHGDWHAFVGGRLAARRFGIGTFAASLHEWARAPDRRYRHALRGYAPIFTTGAREAERLSRILGKETIHLPSAPTEIFFDSATKTSDSVDVTAVGTINARKNYELLIECAARLPHVSFAIFGNGPERPRLEALAAQRGATNVHFAGHVSPVELRNRMSAARLFVNTALAEGSPTAALEAMACGLPVVMTPSNDYSSIIDPGLNGVVTSNWSADELVSALNYFLEDPRRLKQGARASRQMAAAHRWDDKARIVTAAMIGAIERCKGVAE